MGALNLGVGELNIEGVELNVWEGKSQGSYSLYETLIQ